MSSLIDHAKAELKALSTGEEDGPDKWMHANVLELIEIFDKQGHSGSSAPFCIEMFKKLALFKPLSPLTGKDDEWMEIYEGTFQNIHCGRVFKSKEEFNGQAYDLEAVVFKHKNGGCYVSRDSRRPITFPYTPVTSYVDAPED